MEEQERVFYETFPDAKHAQRESSGYTFINHPSMDACDPPEKYTSPFLTQGEASSTYFTNDQPLMTYESYTHQFAPVSAQSWRYPSRARSWRYGLVRSPISVSA